MISAILDCRCGNSPRLVSKGGKRRYVCMACGVTGPKADSIPEAAAGWNSEHADGRKKP